MRYKATFLTGFGAGYVLGAKAGRQRYESITRVARDFMEKPAVQETAGVLQAQAADLAGTAKRVVSEKVPGRSSGTRPDVGRTMDGTMDIDRPVYPVPPTAAPGGTTPTPTSTPTDGGTARH
jgi:hypothetical protein